MKEKVRYNMDEGKNGIRLIIGEEGVNRWYWWKKTYEIKILEESECRELWSIDRRIQRKKFKLPNGSIVDGGDG